MCDIVGDGRFVGVGVVLSYTEWCGVRVREGDGGETNLVRNGVDVGVTELVLLVERVGVIATLLDGIGVIVADGVVVLHAVRLGV